MQALRIKSIKSIGIKPSLDLEVDSENHNFYAEGVVSHNSHSVAYASLAAATIFLKYTYPKQFFLSLLRMSRHEPDSIKEISKIHQEMSYFNIPLLRPHITKSKQDFEIEGDGIRFGLLSIRGISDKSISKLNEFCSTTTTNKFDVFEASAQSGLNIGILCALIQAGAFDGFKQTRTKVVYEAQVWNLLTPREKKLVFALAEEYEYDLVKILEKLFESKNEKGKLHIRETRQKTIREKSKLYKEIFYLNSKSEKYANWYYERKLLGYTYNLTLKDIFSEVYENPLKNISEILSLSENHPVCLVAIVSEKVRRRTSRAGNKYLTFDCVDETGSINIKVFEKQLKIIEARHEGSSLEEDDIIIIEGTKKEGATIFANNYGIQTNKICTKLSEIKAEYLDKEPKE